MATLSSNTSTSTLDESTDDGEYPIRKENSAANVKTGESASNAPRLELDQDGRISSYLSFDEFYQAMTIMPEEERERLEKELEPRCGYVTIPEEPCGSVPC